MRTLKFLIVVLVAGNSFGQPEFSKWYFGNMAGLDFSTSPPTPLTNGFLWGSGGFASVADNSGNLLFYTNGAQVANSTHTYMANGTVLSANQGATQSALIVKQPGSGSLYYIFTVDFFGGANGHSYSIVDMSLAAGLGSVTVNNTILYTPTSEKQVAVRHCNGKDVWIVSHEAASDKFRAYLLNSTGLSATPVISSAGEIQTETGVLQGQLKVSPDGRRLAMATAHSWTPSTHAGFTLFDFDPATGVVSNSLQLLGHVNTQVFGYPYGVEFSADGSKLYGTSRLYNTHLGVLYQWDICAPTVSAVLASQFTVSIVPSGTNTSTGSLQRANDDKIYLSIAGESSLSVINNPNAAGAAMNFVVNQQDLGGKTAIRGLPNYINNYASVAPPANTFSYSVNCNKAVFHPPAGNPGCSTTQNYLWDFGDPASGSANISSLGNPEHVFSGTGDFTVTLIRLSVCPHDTLHQVVSVTATGPVPVISGNTVICAGESAELEASGGSGYAWSNGAATPTISVNPLQTTVYTATVTLNGCPKAQSFTLEVSECAGIRNETSQGFALMPNPADDYCKVFAGPGGVLTIYDLSKKKLFEKEVGAGEHQVDLSRLAPGIYIVEMRGLTGSAHCRLIKTTGN